MPMKALRRSDSRYESPSKMVMPGMEASSLDSSDEAFLVITRTAYFPSAARAVGYQLLETNSADETNL